MTLRISAEAQRETKEIVRWYEDKRDGLGDDFLEELDALYRQIENVPRFCARFPVPDMEDREFRRAMIQRFPYKVIYEIRDTEIIVLAVAHTRRKPNYWIDRAAE